MGVNCKICGQKVNIAFEKFVLKKYVVKYYKCSVCGFLQTETPFWLNEAYESVITSLDIGIVGRNIKYADAISYFIKFCLTDKQFFLDYGGGFGLFVRMMRDKGFNFYRQDYYCENIFSKNFDLEDISKDVKFNLLTAFEVFEHLENPLDEIKKMLNYSDIIVFSTELQGQKNDEHLEEWWYLTPETGQHISFYSRKALKKIAEKLCLEYYSFDNNWHFFYKKKSKPKRIFLIRHLLNYRNVLERLKFNSLPTLLQNDYQNIKKKL